MNKNFKIALLGQPNSGKSTVFNTLTGSHQHVGNWPGKTVEKKEGFFEHNKITYELVDLPGSYSLSANSQEELVTRDYITNGDADLVCILVDGSQLERSFYMVADYAGIKIPMMILVTMTDVAEDKGIKIDLESLSKVLDVPVVGIVGPDKKTYDTFFKTIEKISSLKNNLNSESLYNLYKSGREKELYEEALNIVESDIGNLSKEWLAVKLMEADKAVIDELISTHVDKNDYEKTLKKYIEKVKDASLYTSDCKFSWIENILEDRVVRDKNPSALLTKFDKLAISKRWGKPISIGIIILGLIATFVVAIPLMLLGGSIGKGLGILVSFLSNLGVSKLPIDFIQGTFVNSIYWTLSMLGFVFGVNFVFGYLEEAGYMARVSYVFDDTMSGLGLQGKSIMPMIISLGCTIGGATGTRVIDSWGQKILTMSLLWAVPCGATFAVIPTLATAFFGWKGIFVFVLIFGIMFIHIKITAKIFGQKLNPEEMRTGLIMELPPYHKVRFKSLLKHTLIKVWGAFRKAFTVILLVSVAFFFISYSPDGMIENTIIYKVGVLIEPITKIFGLGWETFLAFTASMVSKEAVLGVLSSIFVTGSGDIFGSTVGSVAADANLGTVLVNSIPKAEALAFMIAVTFNIPCLMAVTSTYEESHSLKWTLIIALYYVATALILSSIVFHVANIFM